MGSRVLPLLFLAAVLPATGCTTTRLVPRTTALADADAALRGRHATINLTTGAFEWGRVAFVRPDSTGWTFGPTRRTVPTTVVYSIVRNTRPAMAGRGALVGAGVLLGISLLAVAADGGDEDSCGFGSCFGPPAEVAVVLFTLSGAVWGGGIGVALGRQTEYRIVE